MKKPEKLVLTLCHWAQLHAGRGETHCLKLGGKQYSVVSFEFNEWRFNKPTAGFVMEFTHYFIDRVLVIDEIVCPDCCAELDKEINTAIVDAHGIPPKEVQ